MIPYGESPKSTTHTILPIMSTLVNSQSGCGENNRKKVLLKQLVNGVLQDPGSTCKQWLTLPNRMVPGPRFSLGVTSRCRPRKQRLISVHYTGTWTRKRCPQMTVPTSLQVSTRVDSKVAAWTNPDFNILWYQIG